MRHVLTRRLPYSADQLFDLVADVEAYPRFLPWVTRLTIVKREPADAGIDVIDAEAHVSFAFVRERFSTRVRLDRAGHAIDVSLISGPFRRLENHWRFGEASGGADLRFEIDFEFRSRMLAALLAANMHRAVRRLIACFEDRARRLYGPGV